MSNELESNQVLLAYFRRISIGRSNIQLSNNMYVLKLLLNTIIKLKVCKLTCDFNDRVDDSNVMNRQNQ